MDDFSTSTSQSFWETQSFYFCGNWKVPLGHFFLILIAVTTLSLLLFSVTLVPCLAFYFLKSFHLIHKEYNSVPVTLLLHWSSPFLGCLNSDHSLLPSNHGHQGRNNCILISPSPKTEMLHLLPQLPFLSPDKLSPSVSLLWILMMASILGTTLFCLSDPSWPLRPSYLAGSLWLISSAFSLYNSMASLRPYTLNWI